MADKAGAPTLNTRYKSGPPRTQEPVASTVPRSGPMPTPPPAPLTLATPLAEANPGGDQTVDDGRVAPQAGRRQVPATNNRRNLPSPDHPRPPGSRSGGYYKAATGNERLYEAYNELHSLAQEFRKPFDAPAILVVGHQTDGKSALVEALMGFQFNHVGGGTKTRRPVTLHMKYASSCVQPVCWLVQDDGEEERSLEELQEYIHNENARLEAEGQFWAKEIVVKIEYKFCPNLTIIDTPGLISAAPSKKNLSLQMAARQVEIIVRAKMEQKEYIILCLEDTSDWNNATTRRLVMQVDPTMERTVVVSTKLDTRIPQFSTPQDAEMFLRPQAVHLEPTMLCGTPFFTSVPSGRVGLDKDSTYTTNDGFREAVAERELRDVMELENKMGRRLDKQERARVGVGQLRNFLEQMLQRQYHNNVPSIVPLLEREARSTAQRLDRTRVELMDLHPDRLKDKGRTFREAFLAKLILLLRGTMAAPADTFGETLGEEHMGGGAFVGPDGKQLQVSELLPNAQFRLFGGAQFHRAVSEFRLTVGQIACPDISREDIVNACGMEDAHDGVNYVRTACVIAVEKAKDMFEPFIHQLGFRLSHVLRRLLPPALYLLQREGQSLSGHDLFLKRVGDSFQSFIDEIEKSCKAKCLEDLQSTTRYVSWSLHTRGQKGLSSMLAKVKVPAAHTVAPGSSSKGKNSDSGTPSAAESANQLLVDILESTLWARTLGPLSEEVVAALVCQIFEGIRDHIITSVELKFNCFFLMPVIDAFPTRLREELESAYDEDLDEVFDATAVRAALEQKLKTLEAEVHMVEKLQRKFAIIHATLAQQQPSGQGPMGNKLRPSLMSLNDSTAMSMLGAMRKAGGRSAAPHYPGGGDDTAAPSDVGRQLPLPFDDTEESESGGYWEPQGQAGGGGKQALAAVQGGVSGAGGSK